FARITAKISTFTVLQYINYINDRPLGHVKYALN
ncbi:IS982 family transposase, partial [Prevotella pallens]